MAVRAHRLQAEEYKSQQCRRQQSRQIVGLDYASGCHRSVANLYPMFTLLSRTEVDLSILEYLNPK